MIIGLTSTHICGHEQCLLFSNLPNLILITLSCYTPSVNIANDLIRYDKGIVHCSLDSRQDSRHSFASTANMYKQQVEGVTDMGVIHYQ